MAITRSVSRTEPNPTDRTGIPDPPNLGQNTVMEDPPADPSVPLTGIPTTAGLPPQTATPQDQLTYMAQQFQAFAQMMGTFMSQQTAAPPPPPPPRGPSVVDRTSKSIHEGYIETDESNYQTTKERDVESVSGVKALSRSDGGAELKNLLGLTEPPFSEGIMKEVLPKKIVLPKIDQYEGKTDPTDHLCHYRQSMTLHECCNIRSRD